ncbi:hypothetical protein CWI36_1266p0030 [Hamiltosporidium magnivora]|uniref:Uncharacterized protein n=1 Tax=Hamiltosporidium magnivora TaxID=148818 RepID=A0A4Q9L3M9_9MICR|nr:hypothetical protein CWI36_1266p0030 [Hamiltosporidium magnivora]
MGGIKRSGMHKETNPPLKQASNDNNCAKHAKTKNYRPFFRRRTSLDEPTINISDESNLEDERSNSNPSTPDYIDLIARSEASLQRAPILMYRSEFSVLKNIDEQRVAVFERKETPQQGILHRIEEYVSIRLNLPEQTPLGRTSAKNKTTSHTFQGFEPYTSLKMESGKAQDSLN